MVLLTRSVWDKLSLPYAHTVHFHLKNNQLYIGPLIGLFTTGVIPFSQKPVGTRSSLLANFLRAQKDNPTSYFLFGPKDIKTQTKRIHGLFLRKQHESYIWSRQSVPFPNVVFDRVPNRKCERSLTTQKAKTILSTTGVRIFNPGFFNKWTIHEHIQDCSNVQAFIPETIFTPKASDIRVMLDRHKMVYLKPANGSSGLGIIKLSFVPNKGFYAHFRSHDQNKLQRFAHLQAVLDRFPIEESSTLYIAQQGIQLLNFKQRPVDFRVHTNKNRYGQWEMTAVAAKVAGKGSCTTHLRSGGKVLPYQVIFDHCLLEHDHKQVLNNLNKAVIKLAQAIDENLPGHFGELGFDMGIDQAGHPWMFEANSKPGRHVFSYPHLKDNDRITRNMIIEYALFLSKFTTKDVPFHESHSAKQHML